jgi:3-oxoacyl-[acyl-carrier-protein] synthase II
MKQRRVVITGLGAVTPLGNSVPAYWEGLVNGVSGAAPITRFDASRFKTQFACEVKDFDPNNYFDRKEVRKFDQVSLFGLVSAAEAIQDSKLKDFEYNPLRVGVIWASGIGGIITFAESMKDFLAGDGTPRFSPFFIPKMIADITAGHISMVYNFQGPNYATVSACASAGHAMADAMNHILLNKADVMVVGGSEAAICEPGIGGFNAMHAISTRNDDPKTASRPFDKDRDGFVMGEGGAGLIFEELEHALARGANIYAEVCGYGLTADAHHLTAPHPDGDGAYYAMKFAIEDAGLTPQDVDHINTHGTSTPVGDIAEPKAIQRLFGDHAYNIAINATKSMHGHLLGAAASIEAIAAILAIRNGIVPPTINHFTDDPEIDNKLNFCFNSAQKKNINVAISNSFGFGGHNVSVLFRKYNG